MTEHQHTWKHDKSRVHKRDGFIFVICACGERGQVSTLANGKWRAEEVFQTNHYRGGSRVISFRVTDKLYAKWLAHRNELLENFHNSIDKF